MVYFAVERQLIILKRAKDDVRVSYKITALTTNRTITTKKPTVSHSNRMRQIIEGNAHARAHRSRLHSQKYFNHNNDRRRVPCETDISYSEAAAHNDEKTNNRKKKKQNKFITHFYDSL